MHRVLSPSEKLPGSANEWIVHAAAGVAADTGMASSRAVAPTASRGYTSLFTMVYFLPRLTCLPALAVPRRPFPLCLALRGFLGLGFFGTPVSVPAAAGAGAPPFRGPGQLGSA